MQARVFPLLGIVSRAIPTYRPPKPSGPGRWGTLRRIPPFRKAREKMGHPRSSCGAD